MKTMKDRIKEKKPTEYSFTALKGAMGELEAANFFMRRGYFVFRNLASHGPDLIVKKGNKIRVVEVKHGSMVLAAPNNQCDWVFYIQDDQYLLWNVETDDRTYHTRKTTT